MIPPIDPPPLLPAHPRLVYLRDHFVIWCVALMVAMLPVIVFVGNTTELYPSHSPDIEKISFSIAITVGLTAFVTMVIIQPAVRGSRIIAGVALPFALCVFAFLTSMIICDAIFQHIDFAGPNTVRGYRDFALRRVHLTTGKGSCYRVELADFQSDFCISRTDFAKAKADMQGGWYGSYCLHTDAEKNGSAIRIMHSTGHTLSPGALIRCQIGRPTSIG